MELEDYGALVRNVLIWKYDYFPVMAIPHYVVVMVGMKEALKGQHWLAQAVCSVVACFFGKLSLNILTGGGPITFLAPWNMLPVMIVLWWLLSCMPGDVFSRLVKLSPIWAAMQLLEGIHLTRTLAGSVDEMSSRFATPVLVVLLATYSGVGTLMWKALCLPLLGVANTSEFSRPSPSIILAFYGSLAYYLAADPHDLMSWSSHAVEARMVLSIMFVLSRAAAILGFSPLIPPFSWLSFVLRSILLLPSSGIAPKENTVKSVSSSTIATPNQKLPRASSQPNQKHNKEKKTKQN